MDVQRPLPTQPNDPITHEFIHESVIQHSCCPPEVKALVDRYPELVCPLGDFETAVKNHWPYDENSDRAQEYLDMKTRSASKWLKRLRRLSRPLDQADTTADTQTTSTSVLVSETTEVTITTSSY
jgi:hypothetical protein